MNHTLAVFPILSLLAFGQSEPKTAEEFYGRAQSGLAGKQMERVIEDCTQAVLLDPDFQEALTLRSMAYSNLKQYDRAIADLDAVLRMHPRAVTFVSRGNLFMLVKKYDAALADFSEAIKRLPNRPAAYELRANARQRLGDTSGAAEDRSKAGELAGAPAPAGFVKPGSSDGSKPGVLRIGGGVLAPRILTRKEPAYSEPAREAKIQGNVVLTVVVDERGMARDFQIVRALGYGLDEKAIEAVQQWKFQPGTKDGSPVAVFATIEVTFRLL